MAHLELQVGVASLELLATLGLWGPPELQAQPDQLEPLARRAILGPLGDLVLMALREQQGTEVILEQEGPWEPLEQLVPLEIQDLKGQQGYRDKLGPQGVKGPLEQPGPKDLRVV